MNHMKYAIYYLFIIEKAWEVKAENFYKNHFLAYRFFPKMSLFNMISVTFYMIPYDQI